MQPPSQLCERARAWASLRADGELSELESALLDGHLGRCASCHAFAQGTVTLAAALREVELEAPARPVVVALRRDRPQIARRVIQYAAAAAVIVATGAVAATSGPSTSASAAKPVSIVAGVEPPDLLRQLRRPGLIERAHVLPRNRKVPGEAV
jgi:predicted anti-sigma-YlaC factor YlaD